MILHYSLHAAAFVIAVIFGFRAAREHPELKVENALRRSKALVIISACLLAVIALSLAALFHDPFCALLPLIVQRSISWITWGVISVLGGLVSGYTLSLALARNHRQRRMLLLATVLLNVATAFSSFRFLAPVAPRLGEAHTLDGVILQTENSTCAAATLANIAGRFGDSLSEKEAAELLKTARLGTQVGQIRSTIAALGYGYETLKPAETKSLSQVTAPAVLFIDHPNVGNEAHAVAYMGETERGFEIWDPLTGREIWNEAIMNRCWHGNGIMCSPP